MAKLHEGIYGSHIGGRSLSSKAIHAGYYCPTMRKDCTRYAQQCKQFQNMLIDTRRLRGVEVDLQPMAISYPGDRYSGAFPFGNTTN